MGHEMNSSFVSMAGKDFNPNPEDHVMDSMFRQYERVVFQSLITSFGLDAFIKDQVGGDVDTIHNVRSGVEYKNDVNKQAYENRGAYNSDIYHKDARYIEVNRKYSKQRKDGELVDTYTGEKIPPRKGASNLDHVISAKEVHDDPGRVLSGLKGVDLANSPENLKPTNPRTNKSKGASTMDEFLGRRGDEYTEEEKSRMRKADKESRTSYNNKINTAYYTSADFWMDTGKATAKTGVNMGLRQALGLAMTEVWFAVKDELAYAADSFEAKLEAIAQGIKLGFNKAREKFASLLAKFGEGAVSGVFSSLTATLCNIFFTTAKNIVRVIRMTWASIVEATKILIFNPDDLPFSERMTAALKIIATGASVVLGATAQEAVHAALTPHIGALPGLSAVVDIASVFTGSLCTGFLTVSLLYLIDSDPFEGFLTESINKTTTEYKRQARLFAEHAAKLAELDIAKFEQEAALCRQLALHLETANDDYELSERLAQAMNQLGVASPWGERSLDEFMDDPDAILHFKA